MIPAARIPHRTPRARHRVGMTALALLAATCIQAMAAEQDTLANMPSGRQVWRVSDYGNVQLVPREASAPLNQHPVQIQPQALRQQLEGITVVVDGVNRQLFETRELDSDIGPLVEAFQKARPDQDVLLVSVARRDGNMLLAPTAITSRLFYTDNHLNFIVRDPRYDFYDRVRGTNVNPVWVVGSRTAAGSANLARMGAASKRPDWLVFDLSQPAPMPVAQPQPAVVVGPAVTAAPAAAAPAQMAAPAAAPAPAPRAAAAPVVAPVAPVAAPPATAAPAAASPGATDAEHRLETLKRLYDKGLISSEEYQRKRKEIIDAL